jgi:hypothetical protein
MGQVRETGGIVMDEQKNNLKSELISLLSLPENARNLEIEFERTEDDAPWFVFPKIRYTYCKNESTRQISEVIQNTGDGIEIQNSILNLLWRHLYFPREGLQAFKINLDELYITCEFIAGFKDDHS